MGAEMIGWLRELGSTWRETVDGFKDALEMPRPNMMLN